MLTFELEPVDGGTSIPVPEGETVLGRGPILGISDKRVSRHHSLLENQAGQLRIKPIHVNPCFSQLSLDDPPRPLEKDKWHALHPGDLFSLLPGKHIFRVVCSSLDSTQRNSQALTEEEDFHRSPEQNGQSDSVTPDAKEQDRQTTVTNPREEESSLKQTSIVDSGGETEARPRFEERKRVLPAWMTQTAADVGSPASPKTGKRNREKATPSQSQKAKSKLTRSTAVSTEEDSELSEDEQMHRKRRRRKMSDKEEMLQPKPVGPADVKSKWPLRTKQGEASEGTASAVLELGTEKAEERSAGTSLMDPRKARCSKEESMDSVGQEDRTQSTGDGTRRKENSASSGEPTSCSTVKPRLRASCPYGKSCYRKNPVHFQECSHPGDSDYVEEEEETGGNGDEEDDGRPECPYGTNCYRKNPQHKKEYKHLTHPGKRASSRRTKAGQREEDNFSDEESEDVDEDSEYVPSESDDSMEMKRQKKAFLRK